MTDLRRRLARGEVGWHCCVVFIRDNKVSLNGMLHLIETRWRRTSYGSMTDFS